MKCLKKSGKYSPIDTEEMIPEPKLLYEMEKLQKWFNPVTLRIVEFLTLKGRLF
jgi:hypothetical protein